MKLPQFKFIPIRNKTLRMAVGIHGSAVLLAAIRFKLAGGVLTKEAVRALILEPIHVWKVAIRGPDPSTDLVQTGQTTFGGQTLA